MERTWDLRKGQLKGEIGSYVVVGRRDLGITVNEMKEFFSRIKMIKIAGIIGYGFDKGDIKEDKEALRDIQRLTNQILNM